MCLSRSLIRCRISLYPCLSLSLTLSNSCICPYVLLAFYIYFLSLFRSCHSLSPPCIGQLALIPGFWWIVYNLLAQTCIQIPYNRFGWGAENAVIFIVLFWLNICLHWTPDDNPWAIVHLLLLPYQLIYNAISYLMHSINLKLYIIWIVPKGFFSDHSKENWLLISIAKWSEPQSMDSL